MTEKEAIEEAKNVLVSMFGAVVPALEERDDDPTCDAADDYTIGFATYLMQKRCDEVDRLQSEIKQLEKENKQLKTECTLLDDELRIARQDTIDVLNKLKEKIFHCLGIENIQQASGLSLLGSLVPYDIVIDNIDELIKEYV